MEQLGDCTLYLGDCLEVLPTLADKSVDAVIVDAPYGIDYQSARRIDKSQWKPKIANDKEPFIDWLPEAYRVTKDGGALLSFCRWDVEEIFRKAIVVAGYLVKSQIIWDKVVHGMGDLNGQFAPQHENIWFATKGKFEFWADRPKSVIRCKRIDPEKLVHPNEKPEPLLVRLVELVVPPTGNVLDCFMGSNSTGAACVKLNRRYTGIEINPDYYQIARSRILAAQAQLHLPMESECHDTLN